MSKGTRPWRRRSSRRWRSEGNGQGDADELEDTLTNLQPVAAGEAGPRVGRACQAAEEAAALGPAPVLGVPRPRLRRRCCFGGALFGLSRAYFVGADEQGNVVVYQGVPFDLTAGTGLYRERYVSRLQAAQLSPEERAALFDHELVSYDRARARVAVYEAEAVP